VKILILGAGGFIGAHLTKRALEEGHQITAVDTCGDKLQEFLKNRQLTFLKVDIRQSSFDQEKLVINSDLVIDLIAYANPGLYVKIPLEVFRLNFTENLKIAECCVKHNKRLIQFSTCEVYGKTVVSALNGQVNNPEDPSYATFSEDESQFILGPVNKHRWIYASAKQLLERVIHAYGIEEGFNYTIIRPFNFIGPKIDYLPQDTDGIPRVFSFFMEALINGTPMKLVDGGKNRRCYTYIDDAIECIYKIIENPGGVCNQRIFNIGSPENEVSIFEFAKLMRKIYSEDFGCPVSLLPSMMEVSSSEFYGEGYEDSDRRIPDITAAQRDLDWKPRWGLREMLKATMSYYIDQQLKHSQIDNIENFNSDVVLNIS
jgi:UDP-apiose/xylose synthase